MVSGIEDTRRHAASIAEAVDRGSRGTTEIAASMRELHSSSLKVMDAVRNQREAAVAIEGVRSCLDAAGNRVQAGIDEARNSVVDLEAAFAGIDDLSARSGGTAERLKTATGRFVVEAYSPGNNASS